MKKELIKTDDYLLVVDDSEIKDFYYDKYSKKVHESGGAEYSRNDITKNIIAYLPINHQDFLEGVPLLPPLEVDYISSLAKDEIGWYDKNDDADISNFIKGYNKARQKYKFTEEDMKKAADWYFETKGKKPIEELIQSLSQSKMPTHFEFETKTVWVRNTDRNVPTKDDLDYEIKTTTNSQGQEVACGKYIYEL